MSANPARPTFCSSSSASPVPTSELGLLRRRCTATTSNAKPNPTPKTPALPRAGHGTMESDPCRTNPIPSLLASATSCACDGDRTQDMAAPPSTTCAAQLLEIPFRHNGAKVERQQQDAAAASRQPAGRASAGSGGEHAPHSQTRFARRLGWNILGRGHQPQRAPPFCPWLGYPRGWRATALCRAPSCSPAAGTGQHRPRG